VVIGGPRQVPDTPSHPFDDHRNAMARRSALFRTEQAGEEEKPRREVALVGVF
jgi:hypothetical protein